MRNRKLTAVFLGTVFALGLIAGGYGAVGETVNAKAKKTEKGEYKEVQIGFPSAGSDWAEGTLALAEFQSAGRGRLGRSWEVPEGTSVMMSILLRPKFEPQYAPTLTLVMGMAVAKAVKSLGFDVSIKWPNDVVVSHKKICGILTEMGVCDGKIDYAVIGVGINVNIKEFPEEMADKATSLYLESGKEFDRSQIPGLVMEAFEEYYEKFAATCDLSGLKEEYESILANYNQPVRVLAKEPYEGVARGITDGGELLVEKTDGTIVAVSAGEVSVRGLYSYV